MIGGCQTFTLAHAYGRSNYAPPVWRLRYRYGPEFEVEVLANLITAEYKFRQTLQQKEALEKNVRALEKIPGDREEEKQLEEYRKELEAVKRTHSENERNLFAQESMLPPGTLEKKTIMS
ncbi:uncharacterized protein N7479_004638 [Penicillium vulpinum]|uniref:uncharacterized protein n=1 Tax=Penicillium vulpinum TaxID=29845 RepID=UPI002546F251|nr:uncharacterized protein N7479_004638 [Penicillium vulpinum]KAJ5964762.1 hypothetical protein N7479_004638 [Penicillium vulpinum]